MRSLLAAVFALLVSSTASALDFPPSPRQLVAVNPITNKVYLANEAAGTVTVLDAAHNTTKTIAVGSRPQFIVVNPITNRVYVNNGGAATLTVIDGGTDTNLTPTPLALGTQGPMAINTETNIVYEVRMSSVATDEVTYFDATAGTWYTIATESFQPTALAINPATNTLYVAHYGTGDVRVISGAFNNNAHPTTLSISAWSHPFAIAANAMTNKVYVITEDSRGPIGVIDGATNTATWPAPLTGHAVGPKALAVDPVNNKAYALFSGEVVVINADNSFTYIPVNTGAGVASLGINYYSNKIYVANDSGSMTVIDGDTNTTTSVTIPAGSSWVGVNPVTNEAYLFDGANATIVNGSPSDPSHGNPILTNITALPGNASGPDGSISISASNLFPNPLPLKGVWYQLDSKEGAWNLAGAGAGPYTATFSGLSAGSHTLYAFAADGHASIFDTAPQSAPLLGSMASYTFTVSATAATSTTSLMSSANPSTIGQSVTFTASVTGSGSTPTGTVAFTDGGTAISGCSSVALASGSAACTTNALAAGSHTISATYSGDASYSTSRSSLTQAVNRRDATASVSGSPNPSSTGQSVTFTAMISGTAGTPTGTVSFTDGSTTLCSAVALSSGSAACMTTSLAGGAHTITATYSGDATYKAASATTTQTVSCSNCPPGAPTTVSPTGTITTSTPTFTWNASAGATSYWLLVQNLDGVAVNRSVTATEAGCSSSATCSFTPSIQLANGTMWGWYVNAANAFGTSAWSDGKTFRVSAPGVTTPAAPTQLAPSGTIATASPVFTWNASAGATSYWLLVQNLDGVAVNRSVTANEAGCASGSGTCTFDPGLNLANNSTWGWYVNASNSAGTSAWSSGMTFKVSGAGPAVPAKPTLVSPSGTITTQSPVYKWNASPGASYYWLLVQNLDGVAENRAVTPAEAGCASGTGTCSFGATMTLANGTMWGWYVKAYNAVGASDWSDGMAFNVNTSTSSVPAAPTQVSPSGNISTTMPTYTWNASAGATEYYFLVQNLDGVAASIVLNAADLGCGNGTGSCVYTPSQALPAHKTWGWYLQARNSAGSSGFSSGMVFTTP